MVSTLYLLISLLSLRFSTGFIDRIIPSQIHAHNLLRIQATENLNLDFDDTALDDRKNSKLSYRASASLSTTKISSKGESDSEEVVLRRGSSIRVRIKKIDTIGAHVELVEHIDELGFFVKGLILNFELTAYFAMHGENAAPRVGQEVDAFVENIRPADAKVDVCLRPPGYDRVVASKKVIVEYLGTHQRCPVGRKSSPTDIQKVFPQLSKGQFKTAIGILLQEGAVISTERELRLVPVDLREPVKPKEYSGKSPQGWRAPEGKFLAFS
jgi:hypothetical protein